MLTNGYDYIFALSWTAVNAMLTKNLQGKNIEITYNTTDPDLGSTITMDFTLEPWQIVAGGGNTLVNLSLPVASGYMSVEGGAVKSNSYDLTGITIIVQVELGWLGSGDQQQASGSGDASKLVFLPATSTQNPGYVSPVNIIDPDNQLDAIGKGILKQVTVSALVSNKDKLQYIFANVNPSPANVASWLNPKKWQYFNVYSANGPCALAFLCQLSDKAFPPQATFDANSLDASHNTLIMISQKTFFDNAILPSVKKTFPSGSFSSSVNSQEDAKITNNGNFDVGKVTTNSYTLTTSNSGNGLAISASGGGPLKFFFGVGKLPNASYSWSIDSDNPLEYSNKTITFQKDPNPTKHHDQTIHWYDWVLLVVVGITSLPGLISAIVDGVNNYYDDSEAMGIGNINNSVQSSIDNSVVNLTNLVSWNKAGESFTPTIAGLSVSLYVRGDLS